MGCSSSSTQTMAQENRPGTKPEEANGDTGFVASNGTVAEDTETIADQMQLPVQSALSEELGPELEDSETPGVCEILQNVEMVPEQVATESEPPNESGLMQTTDGPERTAAEEPPPPFEPPVLQEESSSAEVVLAQEASATVIEISPEAPAVDERPEAYSLPLLESPPASDQVVSAVPAEVTSEASEAAPVLETTPAPVETTVEHTIVSTHNIEASEVLASEPEPVPERSPIAESALATEPTPFAEGTPVPESTEVIDLTAVTEPTPAAEAAPALEPTLVELAPDHELTQKEPEEADLTEAEKPAAAVFQPQPEPNAEAPRDPEPIHVETTVAAAAAEVVLQAAQIHAAPAATSADANTPDQPVLQAPVAPEGKRGYVLK
ncbi:hypothetical protein NFI96_011475 [Prochilodus magdalenae]|nr:hypothetical protein NFI96_011475 [Prochilodus magdalenae]